MYWVMTRCWCNCCHKTCLDNASYHDKGQDTSLEYWLDTAFCDTWLDVAVKIMGSGRKKNMDEMLKWWQVLSQAGTVKSSFYKTLLLRYVVGYIWSTQSWSGWDNCKSQQKIRRTWELVSNNWFTCLHLTYCRQMHFCFSDDSLDVFDLFL